MLRTGNFHLVVLAVVVLFTGRETVQAFNPQPEPPPKWSIEGYIDLTVTEYVETTPGSRPFGLSPDIVDRGAQSAFIAALRGEFTANGTDRPVAGRHQGTFDVFHLKIGNATWTSQHTSSLLFEIMTGNEHVYVTGSTSFPDHPTLQLFLPQSPGTWTAIDQRSGENRGRIGGTYTLRDGVVPEPSTFITALVGLTWIGTASARRRPRTLNSRELP